MSTRTKNGAGIAGMLGTGQLAAAVAALTVAGAILLAYQFVALRQSLAADVKVQAAIIADNISASLMFHDHDAASEMLRSFHPAKSLRAARVYDRKERLFASYGSQAEGAGVLATLAPALFAPLTITHPVTWRGNQLGRVVLTADTAGVRDGLLRFGVLLALASLGALLTTALVVRSTRTRVAHAEREMAYLAYTDPVTELPNRRASYEALESELAARGAAGERVGLLLIDLDNFKVVNDTAGHAAGDELLRKVALTLLALVREGDLVGRIGGDEFAVIAAPLADGEELRLIAQRIIDALRQPLTLGGMEVTATASVGACVFPDDATNMSELVSNADVALYQAKGGGRDRLAAFRREMIMATQRRAQLERDLRRALDAGALEVVYQPQYASRTGRMVGVEALLRWPHPEHGYISPAEFIPIAEESGLIVELGRWILERACSDGAALQVVAGEALTMAVNVSARQLRERDFVDDVRATLARSGLPPRLLELELTESMLMEDVNAAIEFMHAVRKLGVRLAIDDFGTGYSSLAYLQAFPINQLKIDRSFVRSLPEAGATLASAVISLAHSFHLNVVAEGVETPAQRDWLRDAGCEVLQGYLLGRPMPLPALRRVLAGETDHASAA